MAVLARCTLPTPSPNPSSLFWWRRKSSGRTILFEIRERGRLKGKEKIPTFFMGFEIYFATASNITGCTAKRSVFQELANDTEILGGLHLVSVKE